MGLGLWQWHSHCQSPSLSLEGQGWGPRPPLLPRPLPERELYLLWCRPSVDRQLNRLSHLGELRQIGNDVVEGVHVAPINRDDNIAADLDGTAVIGRPLRAASQ